MNKHYYLVFLSLMVFILVSCSNSNDEEYLTRIDIQQVQEHDASEEEEMIVDLVTLDSIKSILEEVEWEPNSDTEIVGTEDLIATLFYTDEEEKSDQLYLYQIWFNSDDSISIVSSNVDEGYGRLKEEYADKLKNLLGS
ncbi:MAG TPA: hypothetical protein VNS08_12395 [Ureibacillus sp.]|nr:hypothetical protein [Ureibacillus sp.]